MGKASRRKAEKRAPREQEGLPATPLRPQRPYGDCYKASFETAEELTQLKTAALEDPADQELKRIFDGLGLAGDIAIVQGEVTVVEGIDAGRRLCHSWVEVGDCVRETSNKQQEKNSVADYYSHFKIDAGAGHRYSMDEAKSLYEKHGTYGLWHTM